MRLKCMCLLFNLSLIVLLRDKSVLKDVYVLINIKELQMTPHCSFAHCLKNTP